MVTKNGIAKVRRIEHQNIRNKYNYFNSSHVRKTFNKCSNCGDATKNKFISIELLFLCDDCKIIKGVK